MNDSSVADPVMLHLTHRLSQLSFTPETAATDNTQGSKQEKNPPLTSLVVKTREAPNNKKKKMSARKEVYRDTVLFHPKSSKDSFAKEDRV